MPKIRDHQVFEIKYTTTNRDNVSKPHFNVDLIVAPSKLVAKAWAESKSGFIEHIACEGRKLSALIQEHVW